jgi:hypothetical protein
MKLTRRMIVAVVAIVGISAACWGQVINQVPGKAMVVVHVKNLQDLSQKIAALAKEMSVTAQAPPSADLLGFVSTQLKIQQGLKKDGDCAFAWLGMGRDANGNMGPRFVFLLPVTDYQTFLSNFPDAKTDGAITTANIPSMPPVCVAKWGDYAAISHDAEVVSGTPGGLTITPSDEKELDSKDVCVLLNMPAVRGMVLPILIASRPEISVQMTQALRQSPLAKYTGLIRVGFNQIMNFAVRIVTDCDAVTLGFNLADDGVSGSLVADFKPDSPSGQILAQHKSSGDSLLAGLPPAKYLFLGGAIYDPKIAAEIFDPLFDALAPEVDKLGPDGQPVADYIQAFKDILASRTSSSFGMIAPEGELGTSPLMQFTSVATGDAKLMASAVRRMLQTQQKWTKAMNNTPGAMPMLQTFTPDAKTVDGVTMDQYHAGFDVGAAQTPQTARIGQMLTFVYGADGLNMYDGAVNDTTFISVGGIEDDKISAAIVAAKSGDDSVAKDTGLAATAGHLPTQRVAAMYLPMDVVVNTVFGYIAKFGLDMGVTMAPADPIGITVGTDGSVWRMDGYVPAKLIIGAADVSKKLIGARRGGPPPQGGGPAGPGGL